MGKSSQDIQPLRAMKASNDASSSDARRLSGKCSLGERMGEPSFEKELPPTEAFDAPTEFNRTSDTDTEPPTTFETGTSTLKDEASTTGAALFSTSASSRASRLLRIASSFSNMSLARRSTNASCFRTRRSQRMASVSDRLASNFASSAFSSCLCKSSLVFFRRST